MFDAIVTLLQIVLQAFHGVTQNYVMAIVLLTIAIKIVLHPLTRKQLGSMKAMQALAPQMEVLRRKYKGDPKQLNVEVMGLYRANKVNPLGGCLPLLVQLPVLYALFALLRKPGLFGGETLAGVALEAHPTFQVIADNPVLALVPLLSGLTTYYQQKMSITDPQQAKMFIFMPIMIAWFSTQFPLGLSVYWISSTVAYIAEYFIVVGPPRPVKVAAPRQPAGATKTKRKSGGGDDR